MLRETLDHSMELAKYMKSHVCETGPADIRATIETYRGDLPVAMFILRDHTREGILETAALAAAGMDADVLSLTFETYVGRGSPDAGEGLNPVTGKPWKMGEMQQVAEEHDGIAKGWVSEAVYVSIANRAGDRGAGILRYAYTESAFTQYTVLRWVGSASATTLEPNSDWVRGGYMSETLHEVMLHPTAADLFLQLNLTREERDLITIRAVQDRVKCQAMLMSPADDRERVDFLLDHGNIM